jgi:hypothetical protein
MSAALRSFGTLPPLQLAIGPDPVSRLDPKPSAGCFTLSPTDGNFPVVYKGFLPYPVSLMNLL